MIYISLRVCVIIVLWQMKSFSRDADKRAPNDVGRTPKGSRSFSRETAVRESMRDDEIHHVSTYRRVRSRATLALMCPAKLVAVREKGVYNEHRDPPGRTNERGGKGRQGQSWRHYYYIFYTCRIPSWKLHGPGRRGAARPAASSPLARGGFRLRIVRYFHSVPRHSASEMPPRF